MDDPTLRLDLQDPDIRTWHAKVLHSGPDGIVLDRSAFYPGGGGQPPDQGILLWGGVQTRIVGTRKGDDLYLIPEEGDPIPQVGELVTGALDDERRSLLMRTHSGLHVLCGVVYRDFGALVTGSNMEPGTGRMDFNLPEFPPDFRDRITEACDREILADRAIEVRMVPRAEAVTRTAENLIPAELEEVRLVDIVGLDVQADGGTHVASTKSIGRIEILKLENKGKGFRRLRVAITDAS